MALISIIAALLGIALFVMVLALVIDIARWVRDPDANSGLQT
ncbi:hypothetical protein [Natrinema sp. 74]